jgi:hypothetical protein
MNKITKAFHSATRFFLRDFSCEIIPRERDLKVFNGGFFSNKYFDLKPRRKQSPTGSCGSVIGRAFLVFADATPDLHNRATNKEISMKDFMNRHDAFQGNRVRRAAATLFAVQLLSIGAGLNGAQAAAPYIAPVIAAVPIVPPQFDITGFIQEATLDTTNTICMPTHPRLAGGTVTLNGQKVTIPCNTILQMPAFTMTWADLFNPGSNLTPSDITPVGQTGMALTDLIGSVAGATVPLTQPGLLAMPISGGVSPTPLTRYSGPLPSYEVHVVGNVISGQYIAGLVFISQQSLNAGQGVISCIDYSTGEMQVGGVPTDPSAVDGAGNVITTCPSPLPRGVTRVRLNDTIGRYGKMHAPVNACAAAAAAAGVPVSNCVEQAGFDPRFTPDTDNPTIHAASGYPMCIPRVNPFVAGVVDPLCPQSNRPLAPNCKSYAPGSGIPAFPPQTTGYCMTYLMDPPLAPVPAAVIGVCPGSDPLCPTDPTQQVPFEIGDNIAFLGTLKADAAGTYVSAHTVSANLGVYTQPNLPPVYTSVEVVLAGTDGRPVAGLNQEVTGRVKFVGFTTDVTSLVDLYALDQDPVTGAISERLLGTQSAVGSPLLGRFRTPVNNNGAFLPPTRNYRAIARTMCSNQNTLCHLDGGAAQTPVANGLIAGQYLLPNFEFIFAENLTFGQPLVPNNFQDLPFLFCGSGPLDGPGFPGSPVVGQLNPPPWAAPMDDPIFHSTLCPTVPAVAAARVFPPVVGASDALTINTATWDNRVGKGKVNVVVTSSRSPAPAGMFMVATLSNAAVAAAVPGSTANPISSEMVQVANSPATPAACPTAAPCWQLLAPGYIIDPAGQNGNGIPTLVPPTTISVRSSLGGTSTTNTITVLPCRPARRTTCL